MILIQPSSCLVTILAVKETLICLVTQIKIQILLFFNGITVGAAKKRQSKLSHMLNFYCLFFAAIAVMPSKKAIVES